MTAPGNTYVKRHPVPFGEYVPARSFFRNFSADIDRVTDQYAGNEVGVLDLGGARLGDLICFEVVYDGLVHDVVDGGAGMLVVQTSNATFSCTDESEQQLALSRLRAVEYGRTVAVAATSSISAVVTADGSVVRSSSLFTPAVFVEEIAQRDSVSVALRLGAAPEWALTAVGAVLAAVLLRLRGKAGDERPGPGDRPDVQRDREHRADPRPAARQRAVGERPRRRRRFARRHRRAGRRAARRPTPRPRAAPAGKGWPGTGLRGGVPLGPRAGLRRRRRDGCRRLAHPSSCRSSSTPSPERADLVLGSRYVPVAASPTGRHRLLLSQVGNRYTR